MAGDGLLFGIGRRIARAIGHDLAHEPRDGPVRCIRYGCAGMSRLAPQATMVQETL
jgi:hypothetical protein